MAAATADAEEAKTVESVYCETAGTIVPLDEGFCRACSQQVSEGDGVHRPVTPDMLKQLDYATTEVPATDAQGEGSPAEESQSEGDEDGKVD